MEIRNKIMKGSYKVKHNYLHIKATGKYTLSEAKDSILKWLEKAHSLALNNILCDLTLVTGYDTQQISTIDRFKISKLIVESIPKYFKLAILTKQKQFVKDHFEENVMLNRGVVVKVTINKKEALKWLGVV